MRDFTCRPVSIRRDLVLPEAQHDLALFLQGNFVAPITPKVVLDFCRPIWAIPHAAP